MSQLLALSISVIVSLYLEQVHFRCHDEAAARSHRPTMPRQSGYELLDVLHHDDAQLAREIMPHDARGICQSVSSVSDVLGVPEPL